MKNDKVKRLFNIYGYTGGNFAGNVYEKNALSPTIINFSGGGNRQPLILDVKYIGIEDEPRVYSNIIPTLSARDYKDPLRVAEPAGEDMRIRKLTPKECWRLMGFTDEDFSRAQAVNSDTQLYKQAGNSIVVQVLEAIFAQMLP